MGVWRKFEIENKISQLLLPRCKGLELIGLALYCQNLRSKHRELLGKTTYGYACAACRV